MKSFYTPGPWHAVNYNGFFAIQKKDKYDHRDNLLDLEHDSRAANNAQLAAAAPQLYESLEKILNIVSSYDTPEDVDIIKIRQIAKEAKAAILKATITKVKILKT